MVEQDGLKTVTKTVIENYSWMLIDYPIVTAASVLLVLMILYVIKIASRLFKNKRER